MYITIGSLFISQEIFYLVQSNVCWSFWINCYYIFMTNAFMSVLVKAKFAVRLRLLCFDVENIIRHLLWDSLLMLLIQFILLLLFNGRYCRNLYLSFYFVSCINSINNCIFTKFYLCKLYSVFSISISTEILNCTRKGNYIMGF